ncbi:MAG: hypothetical protein L3J53_01040 [Proteobacteria bacterium]|nr:hypothetical protein [Pseudomonadota bacterium]
MTYLKSKLHFIFFSVLLLLPDYALAHVKWFVEFDVSDPPQSLLFWLSKAYIPNLLMLSILGVVIASLIDSFWYKRYGSFNYIRQLFSHYDDIGLNIARIGTGVFCVIIWIVGGVILTPELLSDAWFVPYVQLLIAIMVIFKRTIFIAGGGLLFLYGYAVFNYGLFHLLDYLLLAGLGLFLILSAFKNHSFFHYRYPILYGMLIFSFLWSAIEKLAYHHWFYAFIDKYPFLTMGFEKDFFLASAAFVEFALFFLLLMGKNSFILLALLINLLIISGNIYFGKIDAIGHFPVNFILIMMLIKGPLPIKTWYFNHSCKSYAESTDVAFVFFIILLIMFTLYYGLHWLMY